MDVIGRLSQAIGVSPRKDADENEQPSNIGDTLGATQKPSASRKSAHQRRGIHPDVVTFRDTWLKIRTTLSSPDQAALHHGIERSGLKKHMEALCDVLVSEANRADEDADIAGPCMEMLLEGDLLGQMVKLTASDRIAGSQAEVVRLFATLTILLDERFLSRQAVHRPLVRLMRICIGEESFAAASAVEADFAGAKEDEEASAQRRWGRLGSAEALGFGEQLVELMCHVASRLRNSPELLIIFFRERGGDEQSRRAFNVAMSGSSGTPSRVSTRASSPQSFGNPHTLSFPRTSQPTVSSPLRPLDASPILGSSPLSNASRTEAHSQASSVVGLPFDFPLFSYLMRFIHRESRTGELARAGVLFLVDVAFAPGRRNLPRQNKSGSKGHATRMTNSSTLNDKGSSTARDYKGRRSGSSTPQKHRRDFDLGWGPSISLARFIMESDFTEVLGAGLGAVYGLLPTRLKLSRLLGAHETGGLACDPARDGIGNHSLFTEGKAATGTLFTSPPADARSEEVRGQMRLLCDILEFAQDILQTTTRVSHHPAPVAMFASRSAKGTDNTLSGLQTSSEWAAVARSFSLNLHSAVRTLFLDNILYPSMLECSDHDGSAFAVLTYLDAILSVLSPDESLARCIVSWLVGADGQDDEELDGGGNGRIKRRKRKSTAMVQLEKEKKDGAVRESSIYYSDVHGRYTIRDLIVDNLQSSVQQSAVIAALRLAHTLFTFQGRYTLSYVMRVEEDDFATSFPTSILKVASRDGEDTSDAEVDDEESFIYPGGAKEMAEANRYLSSLVSHTLREISCTESLQEVRRYLSLLTWMKEEVNGRKTFEGLKEDATSSTGFTNYLDDAESSLRQDSMFTASLRLMHLATTKNAVEDDIDMPVVVRHRISTTDRLVRVLLACLCRFWTNTPEVNAALTGFLSGLLSCPLRSLEGLIYSGMRREATPLNEGDGGTSSERDVDDDRSDDEVRYNVLRPLPNHSKRSEPVLLCVLFSLVEIYKSVQHGLEDFDSLLKERRRGLLFVENLDEVLDGDATGMTDAADQDRNDSAHDSPMAYLDVDRLSSTSTSRCFVNVKHHIVEDGTATSAKRIYLPLPPSATPSQSMKSAPEQQSEDRPAEASAFARLFGRRSARGGREKKASAGLSSERDSETPKPFAQHYGYTAKVGIEVCNVQLSSRSPWSSASPFDVAADGDQKEPAAEGGAKEKRTRFKDVNDEADNGAFTYPGDDNRDAATDRISSERRSGGTQADVNTPISLSLFLDNAVILEEFFKELVAILLVRRAYGVDVSHTL